MTPPSSARVAAPLAVLVLLSGCLFMRPYDAPIPLSTNDADVGGAVRSETVDWRIEGQDPERRHEIVAVFTTGPEGVAEGGGFKLSLGHVLPTEQRLYTPFSLTATSAYFFKINLLKDAEVSSSNPSVRLKVVEPKPARSINQMYAYIKYKRNAGEGVRDSLLRQIDNEFALRVTVQQGRLEPGDEVRVVLGARKGLAPPKREARLSILVRLDGDGDGDFGLIEPAPSFDVYSAAPANVSLVGPSALRPGETSRFVLRVEDDYYLHNLARFESGSVTLEPVPGLDFPTTFELRGSMDSWDGCLTEAAITALSPPPPPPPDPEDATTPPPHGGPPVHLAAESVVRLRGTATIDGATFPVVSNPIELVPHDAPGAWFGDTHTHSVLSYDADRPPEYVWWRMRRQERHDWAALSDHDMIGAVPFAKKTGIAGITESEWEYVKRLADEKDEPGAFVAFKAYEWTSYFYGHRNVYFGPSEEDPPIVHHNRPSEVGKDDELAPVELGEALGGVEDYIAIPHSTAWPTGDTRYHWGPAGEDHPHPHAGDPSRWPQQRLVELYSTHGSSEHHDPEYAVDQGRPEAPTNDPIAKDIMGYNIRQAPADSGNFVQDALAAGWRFGFIGSSDMHYLSHIDQAYGHGIAGVRSPELTRESVWEGLTTRRTWATTGERIVLHFSVGAAPLGGEVPPGPVTVSGRVHGTGELDFVQVVKFDGEGYVVAHSAQPDGLDAEITFEDDGAVGQFWYLKVRQEDGAYAWGSPVWVSAP